MIEARELRIGNWYKNHSEDPFTQIIYGHEIDYVAVYCNPVQLTEEWLFGLGFEKAAMCLHSKEFYIKYCDISNNWWRLDYFEGSYMFSVGFGLSDPKLLRGLKHVHQLQNLYHALTGEEL